MATARKKPVAAMATTPPADEIPSLDALRKLVEKFQVPGIEFEGLADWQHRDLEALAETNRQAYEDIKALVERRNEILQQTLAQWQDALKSPLSKEEFADGGHVRDQHAQRRAGHDQQRLRVVSGHRDGRDLRLVAHLGQEEGDQRRAEHAEPAVDAGVLVVELVGDQHPGRHAEEGQAERPAQHFGAQHRRDPGAQRARRAVVDDGRGEDAEDDWGGPLEAGGQHEGQELGLVADLGQGHHAGGHQECFHAAADSLAG